MQEPLWVAEPVVLAIHRRQLAEHGGGEGVRDSNLLDSALHKPKQLWQYAQPLPDIASFAASYAFGISRNHPFVDGNKRTAYVTCLVFLRLNGYRVTATHQEKYVYFYKLAAGEVSELELAEWLRHTVERI